MYRYNIPKREITIGMIKGMEEYMALEEHMLIQDNQTSRNGLKMNLIMMILNIIIMTGKKMMQYKLKLILQKKRVKPKNQKKNLMMI